MIKSLNNAFSVILGNEYKRINESILLLRVRVGNHYLSDDCGR